MWICREKLSFSYFYGKMERSYWYFWREVLWLQHVRIGDFCKATAFPSLEERKLLCHFSWWHEINSQTLRRRALAGHRRMFCACFLFRALAWIQFLKKRRQCLNYNHVTLESVRWPGGIAGWIPCSSRPRANHTSGGIMNEPRKQTSKNRTRVL